MLKVLKKFCWYLCGVRFVLEVDAVTLVAQLNQPATDLLNSVIVCWISWICLFNFDVKYVPGSKNTVADGLLQRPVTEEDLHEVENNNTDKFLDTQFASVYQILNISAETLGEHPYKFEVRPTEIEEEGDDDPVLNPKEDEWSDES